MAHRALRRDERIPEIGVADNVAGTDNHGDHGSVRVNVSPFYANAIDLQFPNCNLGVIQTASGLTGSPATRSGSPTDPATRSSLATPQPLLTSPEVGPFGRSSGAIRCLKAGLEVRRPGAAPAGVRRENWRKRYQRSVTVNNAAPAVARFGRHDMDWRPLAPPGLRPPPLR
jgi:hypothetical protein